MSKAHRLRRTIVEETGFAPLGRRFEHEYGHACVRLAAQLRASYPEITKQGRRTGRALRNICFFAWSCCRDQPSSARTLIPVLFRAAALLSAQDDYYDNPSIPSAQKDAFCAATNHALRTDSFPLDVEGSLQLRDLAALWSYVAGTIPRNGPEVRSYWIETACRLNEAMAAESRAARRATITYDEYMRTAIHSIGMVFIWATYLAHEHVPITTLHELTPVLLQGARVVRLSNDLASYRHGRNRENAVTLVGGTTPGVRLIRLVVLEAHAFRQSVEAFDLPPHLRGVLLHSMEFLREFYQRSDFDRALAW